MSKKSGLGKFLLGAGIGVGLGILFAPKSGKETRADLKKKKILKQPIAKFDPKTGKVYMVHSDGTSEVVGEARKGRYSERNP